MRNAVEIGCRGVYLSQVAIGSSLTDVGSGTDKYPTKFVVMIEEVDGKPTRNLDEFVKAVREITSDESKKQFYTCALPVD